MSFIDWNLSEGSPQGQYLSQQSALSGLELQQTRRAQSALANVNLGDPNSVTSAMGGLLRAGQIDQANALTNLSYQRALNQARTPNVTTLGQLMGQDLAQYQHPSSDQPQGGQPQQGAQPQPDQGATGLTPEQHGAAARQILQEGANDANDLLNTTDPTARAMKAEALRAKYQQMGIHDANIDEVLGDLSDNGLKQHAAYLQAVANGQDADHPTGMAASQQVLAADPSIRQHLSNLSGMYGDPLFRGGMKDLLGIDIGPGVDTSASITAPLRNAEVGLAFGGPTAQVEARGSAAGSASVGSPPAPGARLTFTADGQPDAWIMPDGTTAAIHGAAQAQSSGSASGTPTTIEGPQGQHVYGTPNVPVGGGPPTFNTGTIGGSPAAGPTQAGAQVNVASGQQYANDLAAAGRSQPMQVALHKMIDLIPHTNMGPGVQVTNGWRSFLQSQLPILNRIIPGMDARALQTADTNQLEKYMVQYAGAQASAYGAGTEGKLAYATSGNPHISMDQLGALDVSRMALALQRADLAKPYLYGTLPKHDGTDYSQFSSNYARTVDPRAFMLDLLPAPDRAKLVSSITSPQDRERFMRGVQAAEAAGFYSRADMPR